MAEEKIDAIIAYHDAVKKLFDNKSTQIFSNNSLEHATAILIEIFKHAEEHVRIFSYNLEEKAWSNGDLRKAIADAYARDVDIKVAIQKETVSDTSISDFFKQLGVDIMVGRAPDVVFNFVEADQKMFRFEEDKNICHAVACANNNEVSMKLHDAFDCFMQKVG